MAVDVETDSFSNRTTLEANHPTNSSSNPIHVVSDESLDHQVNLSQDRVDCTSDWKPCVESKKEFFIGSDYRNVENASIVEVSRNGNGSSSANAELPSESTSEASQDDFLFDTEMARSNKRTNHLGNGLSMQLSEKVNL